MQAPSNPDGQTERDAYAAAGVEDCWDYMESHINHIKHPDHRPPSLELFLHGYANSMAASPEEYAEIWTKEKRNG